MPDPPHGVGVLSSEGVRALRVGVDVGPQLPREVRRRIFLAFISIRLSFTSPQRRAFTDDGSARARLLASSMWLGAMPCSRMCFLMLSSMSCCQRVIGLMDSDGAAAEPPRLCGQVHASREIQRACDDTGARASFAQLIPGVRLARSPVVLSLRRRRRA